MKIAIYGGTFNPIHKGHIKIAKYCIKELDLDKLFFVPNYKSPFKKNEENLNPQDRLNMINIVLEKNMFVSDFEIKRKGVSYTIDTVKYFKNKFPNDEIYLIIGSDNLNKIHKWKNIEQISKLTKIIIFKRENNIRKDILKKINAISMNNPIFDYSSSNFKKGQFNNVDERVMKYISSNYLYINDISKSLLDAKRYKHCVATSNLAIEYARQLGENIRDAWFAGLTHDITKNKPIEWHVNYLKEKGFTNVEKYKLHSLTGFYWLKDEYMLDNNKILESIKNHTTLNYELSNMDKLVFAADKLCEGRKWEGIQKVRELMISDFDLGFKKLVFIIKNNIIKQRGKLSSEQERIYERWI